MVISGSRLIRSLLPILGMSVITTSSAATTPAVPTTQLAPCTSSNLALVPSLAGAEANRSMIQAALDAAAAQNGTVKLSGTFTLSGPLKIASGVTLCSSNSATLKWAGGSAPNFAVQGASSATNIRIANLTFDGAGVWLSGATSARIEANVFKNIKPIGLTDTQDVYGWFGIKLEDTNSIQINNNVFTNIAGSAIQGWRVSGTPTATSKIVGNWFGYMNQSVSMTNAQYITVNGNQGYEIERMAIEFVGDQMTGTPALDHPGITVINNRFGNWRRFDIANCLGNEVCKNRYQVFGISVVSSTGAAIENNVLDCGTGCQNADRGWGIEFSSYESARVRFNTVRGFSQGIGVHWGQSMSVMYNALFDVRTGIFSTSAGSVDLLTVSNNQIEAAPSRANEYGQWGVGIAPQWDHAGAVIISNNTVAYRTTPTTALPGGEFVGINVARARNGGAAASIFNNGILIEGTPVAGFDVYGIRLSGSNGSLSGTTIEGNWVVFSGDPMNPQGTALDGGWQHNGTQGVILQNNVFQNLQKLNRHYNYHDTNGIYSASNNLAINMTSTSATLPNGTSPVIAQPKSVALPNIQVSANPEPPLLNASTNTAITFTSAIGTSTAPAFNVYRWHHGNGVTSTAGSTVSPTYSPGASRVVRLLATNADRALITASRVATQN